MENVPVRLSPCPGNGCCSSFFRLKGKRRHPRTTKEKAREGVEASTVSVQRVSTRKEEKEETKQAKRRLDKKKSVQVQYTTAHHIASHHSTTHHITSHTSRSTEINHSEQRGTSFIHVHSFIHSFYGCGLEN